MYSKCKVLKLSYTNLTKLLIVFHIKEIAFFFLACYSYADEIQEMLFQSIRKLFQTNKFSPHISKPIC